MRWGRLAPWIVGGVLVEVAFVPRAEAIIIRDDVADAEYVVEDSQYPAVATLFPPDDCAATLFEASHLLTVAHCAVDLTIGDTLDLNGSTHTIAAVALHPMWRDGDHYDVAVLRLEESVDHVEPIPLYRGVDEEGQEVTLVGRGVTATGLEGERGNSSDGVLRRATNVISSADDFLLEMVFDAPGDIEVTALEGVGASGDSGGPVLLVEDGVTYLAGLNAFGDAPGGLGIGEYGSSDFQTRVSSYVEWIDEMVQAEVIPDNVFTGDDDGCGCSRRGGSTWGWGALTLLAFTARRRQSG